MKKFFLICLGFLVLACAEGNGIRNLRDNSTESGPSKQEENIRFKFIEDKMASISNTTCRINDNQELICWGSNEGGILGLDQKFKFANETVIGQERFKHISGGTNHFCGITIDNFIMCWGDGASGKLGNGSNDALGVPTRVEFSESLPDIEGDFIYVSAGHMHSCAVHASFKLYCWGDNTKGQLGNGEKGEPSFEPVEVQMDFNKFENNFYYVSAGHQYTCAIHETQKPFCWGDGASGKLGTGNILDQVLPALVDFEGSGSTDLSKKLVTGINNTCAITITYKLYCWGSFEKNLLGITDHQDLNAFKPIEPNLSAIEIDNEFVDVSLSLNHVCAVTKQGYPFCWGEEKDADKGQLGLGKKHHQPIPYPVIASYFPDDVEFSSITTGENHTCGLTDERKYCWGDNNMYQLGLSINPTRNTPYEIDMRGALTFNKWKSVVMGKNHICAIHDNSNLYCWGNNTKGQLGTGDNKLRLIPTKVVIPEGTFSQVDIYGDTTCAVSSSATKYQTYCWGDGQQGFLRHGLKDSNKPIKTEFSHIPELDGWGLQHISMGRGTTFGLTMRGHLVAWGYLKATSLNATSMCTGLTDKIYTRPQRLGYNLNNCKERYYTHVATLSTRALGISDGIMINLSTLLGPPNTSHDRFREIFGAHDIFGVKHGSMDAFALHMGSGTACLRNWHDGPLYCQNNGGSYAEIEKVPSPEGLSNVWRSMTNETATRCGIHQNKKVYCWGRGLGGALGNGSFKDQTIPTEVDMRGSFYDNNFKSITASYASFENGARVCAIHQTGALHCWGGGDDALSFHLSSYHPR